MSEKYSLNDNSMIKNRQSEAPDKRPTGKLILIGVLSYLLFLLVNLPAAVVWQTISGLVGLPVQLSHIQGTLWSGSVGSVTVRTQQQPLLLPNLAWSLQGSYRILLGQLSLNVQLGNPSDAIEATGSLTLSLGSVEINDATLSTTTQWLLNAVDAPVPGQVIGRVDLQLDRLAITTQGCSAISGRGRLANLQLRSPLGSLTIGDITASLACKNRALLANVKQTSADMTTTGTFTLNSQGNYRFQGETRTNSDTPTAVKQALAMITSENAGTWPLQFQGKLH